MKLSFTLYFTMAVTGALAVFLGTDEAAKYIEAEDLFWARGINGVLASIALTMKGWTSQGFQNWLDKKKAAPDEPAKTP